MNSIRTKNCNGREGLRSPAAVLRVFVAPATAGNYEANSQSRADYRADSFHTADLFLNQDGCGRVKRLIW